MIATTLDYIENKTLKTIDFVSGDSLKNIKKEAEKLLANAIVGVRCTNVSTKISKTGLLFYGTAVKYVSSRELVE